MPRSLPPFAAQLAAALGKSRSMPCCLTALHGRIGDRVYKTYRRPRGQVRLVVTRVPDFTGYTPTAAQRTQRTRMRAATAYAKQVYATPAAKALYLAAAQKLGRCAFRLAITDHLAGRVRVPEEALISPQIRQSAQIKPIGPSAPPDVGRGRRTPPGLALPRIAPTITDSNPPRRDRSVFICGYPRHLRSRSTQARQGTRHWGRQARAGNRQDRPIRPIESHNYYYTEALFYIIALRRCGDSRPQSCLRAYSLSPPVSPH